MQQLPSAREDIFRAHIDWALFDMARAQLVPRLSTFVDKKITEMLGERETTLVRYPTPGLVLQGWQCATDARDLRYRAGV